MDLFVHLLVFNIVVCTVCQHAVLPSQISHYLSGSNGHNITKEARERISEKVNRIEGLISYRAKLDKLLIPVSPTQPPIPVLGRPRTDKKSPAILSGDIDLEAIKQELSQAMQQASEEVKHSKVFDRGGLRALVAPVKDNKLELEYYCVRQVVGLEALFEANRKEIDKEVQMPFNSWINITTIMRYIEVYKQLIYYIFRSKGIEPEKRPGFALIKRQQMAINNIWTNIEEFGDLRNKKEEENRESDKEIEWIGRIQRQILQL
ncbi:hypothetical protein LSUE1_G009367 [Lachnellula suecica]|uniref:Uncharacterized protein n=1 Tax=Lachnellula suecica TaxID=602035 RepID=A0A8T9BU94_9HELO|nr:hypothetical protein LSUE1_G009367 [Lachnellula suecica]